MFEGARTLDWRRLVIALVAVVVAMLAGMRAVRSAAATTLSAASPTAREITIAGWVDPSQPVVDPGGDLWVSARRTPSARDELLRVTPAGRVVRAFPLDVTPVLIGPDGRLWFVTRAAQARLGSVTSSGHARIFDAFKALKKGPTDPQASLDGATVGPNGEVWFAIDSDYKGDHELGYVSPAGHTTVVSLARSKVGWFGLATDTSGYVWLMGLGRLTWISPNDRTGTVTDGDPVTTPLVSDLAGHVWAPEASGDAALEDVGPIRAGGKSHSAVMRRFTWSASSVGDPEGYAPPVGLAAGADGSMWFLGEPCTSLAPLGCGSFGNPILGVVSASGDVISYPSGVPLTADNPQLTAGPGGQFFTTTTAGSSATVGGQAAAAGTLWAITPPDAVRTHDPILRLVRAASSTHSAVTTLRCEGGPGRYCSGMIIVHVSGSRPRRTTYAIDPGHATTYTIPTVHHQPGTQVVVTATNLRRLQHSTQRLTITVRTRLSLNSSR